MTLNSSYQHPWMKAELNEEDRAIMRSGLDAGVVGILKSLDKISNGDDLVEEGASNKIVVFDMPEESADSTESEDDTKTALENGIPFEAIANVRPEEKLDAVIYQI